MEYFGVLVAADYTLAQLNPEQEVLRNYILFETLGKLLQMRC